MLLSTARLREVARKITSAWWQKLGLGLVGAGLIVFVIAPRMTAEYYYLRAVTDPEKGGEYVFWLGRIDKPGAVPPLLRLVKHDMWTVRESVADALARYQGKAVVDALSAMARDDPDSRVQRAAIGALGKVGDIRALPLLKELSRPDEDGRSIVQAAGIPVTVVLAAMAKLGEPGKEAVLDYYRTHPDPKMHARAWFCESEFRRDVKEAVRAQFPEVRKLAAECLPRVVPRDKAIPVLKRLLDDPAAEVQVQGCEELAKLGDTSGFDLAMTLLADTSVDYQVRDQAARVLRQIGDPRALPLLRRVMESERIVVVKDGAANAWQSLHDRFPKYGDVGAGGAPRGGPAPPH